MTPPSRTQLENGICYGDFLVVLTWSPLRLLLSAVEVGGYNKPFHMDISSHHQDELTICSHCELDRLQAENAACRSPRAKCGVAVFL
jgi:hypothetical protein